MLNRFTCIIAENNNKEETPHNDDNEIKTIVITKKIVMEIIT